MAALALGCWLLLLAVAFMLWVRLRAVDRKIDALLSGGPQPLATPLRETLSTHLDTSLLASANHEGLAALPIPYREPQDPYRTAEDLIRHLASDLPATRLADHERSLKAIYHLQATLGLGATETETLLRPLVEALEQTTFFDRPIGKINLVQPDDLVDRRTMWPISTGTRVRQPLGVVIRDRDGTVVSKAKVVCG